MADCLEKSTAYGKLHHDQYSYKIFWKIKLK
jgi:hypothetical protein